MARSNPIATIAHSIVREPLLHFLLIGLLLFAWYGKGHGSDDPRRIIVTQAHADVLAAQFRASWARDPDDRELKSLIDTWIRDEIFYREGEALGLAREDAVVRRRVKQKVEVLTEESAALASPDDAELADFLRTHPQSYRQPDTFTFDQILISAQGTLDRTASLSESVRRSLQRGLPPAQLGLTTQLPHHQSDVDSAQIARDFGTEFAALIGTLTVGTWHGPIKSSFGEHLVRVTRRAPGVIPPLSSIRSTVARDWEVQRRRDALDAGYRTMRARYAVLIEAKNGSGTNF